MVVLRITGWDPASGWTSDFAHTRGMLTDLLRKSTALGHTEAKRLIKALFAREISEVTLVNGEFYNAFRSALQSVGAQIEVKSAQQAVAADGHASGQSANPKE